MFFSSVLLPQQLQEKEGKELDREERWEGDTSSCLCCPPTLYHAQRSMSKFEKFLCMGLVCRG